MILLDRPLFTIYFEPSTFSFLYRPFWCFEVQSFDRSRFTSGAVHFHDRLVEVKSPSSLSQKTVRFRSWVMNHDHPLWLKWPSSSAHDRPLLFLSTVHFRPDTKESLARTDRSDWVRVLLQKFRNFYYPHSIYTQKFRIDLNRSAFNLHQSAFNLHQSAFNLNQIFLWKIRIPVLHQMVTFWYIVWKVLFVSFNLSRIEQ